MKAYILKTIRDEFPVAPGKLKSDIRMMREYGKVPGMDENRVLRTLAELEEDGLILSTLGGFIPLYPVEEVKPKQKGLFA